MSWNPPTIETARMLIREIRKDDLPHVFKYARNPNVAKWTSWEAHKSPDDTEAWYNDYVLKNYAEEKCEPWGIALHEVDENILIGTIGFWFNDPTKLQAEIGFALAEEHWNQGLITEAGRAIREYIFMKTDAQTIEAHHKVGNEASGKVMEKMGMLPNGEGEKEDKGQTFKIKKFIFDRNNWKPDF